MLEPLYYVTGHLREREAYLSQSIAEKKAALYCEEQELAQIIRARQILSDPKNAKRAATQTARLLAAIQAHPGLR